MKKALIVIDMQNDYFKNGNMELVGVDAALKKTNDLVKFAREQEYKIYFVQHISVKEGSGFFVPNTKGVKLHENLNIQNATIIEKNYPNSFRETNLKEDLDKDNIDELIISGAMTHMCIDTTVRAAFDLGYKITLAHDACATRDLMLGDEVIKAKDAHMSFISALGSVFCEVKETAEIVLK
ncbi:MAG: nicotinamidase-related amidase [Sulfurimonas sp.]|jgi:nicotinamidase-related amidase